MAFYCVPISRSGGLDKPIYSAPRDQTEGVSQGVAYRFNATVALRMPWYSAPIYMLDLLFSQYLSAEPSHIKCKTYNSKCLSRFENPCLK